MTYVIVFVAGFWTAVWLVYKTFPLCPYHQWTKENGKVRYHAYFATKEDMANSLNYIESTQSRDYSNLPQYWMKDKSGIVRFHAYFATQEDLDNSVIYVNGNN